MSHDADCRVPKQRNSRGAERKTASQLGKRDLGFQVKGFLVFYFFIFLGLQCKVVGWWQQIFTINKS